MRKDILAGILLIALVLSGFIGVSFVLTKVFTDCLNSIPTAEQGVFNG